MIARHRTQVDWARRTRIAIGLSLSLLVPAFARADDANPGVRTNAPARIDAAGRADSDEAPSRDADAIVDEQPLVRRSTSTAIRHESDGEKTASVRLPKTSLIETFWPMLAVLGLIVGCVAAVRKWAPQATRVSGASAMNILARQYLSSKQSLCLVKVGKRVVLVGVTPDSMNALAEINDPEEIATLASNLNRSRSDAFSSALSKQAVEPDEDDEMDASNAPVTSVASRRDGRLGETEARIQELVGRIRALSVGSSRQK
ncbi:MAG TPA: flagellar biosynthetic protein FliO [Phycisphaerae bacterium]|nr:flagellar biosynthetic protein FliO [Phycisphaerae bacterium]HRW51554.1 flagellar biosynthetic protein FliO [Phycisphaerae bacterium]